MAEHDITALLAPGSASESEEIPDEIVDSGSEFESDSGPDNGSPGEQALPVLDSEDEEFFKTVKPASAKKNPSTFAGMGLSKALQANIQRKGYRQPTPIQRKAIPLILEGQDVVGMARTGSGKTAAFVLPMIESLKTHSAKVGARALILSPNRELALQTLRVVKDFTRKTDLRSVLLVGGDSLEEQFSMMLNNPDIIIATPGRFMHLKIEMGLDLSTIEYVVFDEADRLFEMGFEEQLHEVLASLPDARQTLLFSATLPRTLTEFAKAGLQNPNLVRLDAEQKISDQLQMSFFAIKDGERDATLLYILQDIIHMPTMTEEQRVYLAKRDAYSHDDDTAIEKRERLPAANELPNPSSTIVFVPTKHHVEYVAQLLKSQGYAVSFIYGSLDQAARREQLYLFKAGKTNILVVTDVAARGVDIPMLASVINYNMPTSPRVFVHRVGRTARAGRTGWAYTIVRQSDLPYLVDLEVFLGRKVLNDGRDGDYTERLVLGSLPRDGLEFHEEQCTSLLGRDYDLAELGKVAQRGEKLYTRTREAASKRGVQQAKVLLETVWQKPHPLPLGKQGSGQQASEQAKDALLARLSNRKVKETVFEFKKNNMGSLAEMMARRRQQIAPIQARAEKRKLVAVAEDEARSLGHAGSAVSQETQEDRASTEPNGRFRDKNYMSYQEPQSSLQERGYSLHGTAGFTDAARNLSYGVNDEGKDFSSKQIARWDKKKGKYINTTGENKIKYIRGEDGRKIPASFKSGRYDTWRKTNKVSNVTVDTDTGPNSSQRFKHRSEKAPKQADKARDDFHLRKKRVDAALAKGIRVKGAAAPNAGLQTSQAIQKQRSQKQKRWEKSNQPSKKRQKR